MIETSVRIDPVKLVKALRYIKSQGYIFEANSIAQSLRVLLDYLAQKNNNDVLTEAEALAVLPYARRSKDSLIKQYDTLETSEGGMGSIISSVLESLDT